MQTIQIDGTTYKVKFDRDPLELAKAARKPYKAKKLKDLRKFPRDQGVLLSTGNYVRQFEMLNNLVKGEYTYLNYSGTALYDPSIPLLETFNDE
jgi:hypothetical protein